MNLLAKIIERLSDRRCQTQRSSGQIARSTGKNVIDLLGIQTSVLSVLSRLCAESLLVSELMSGISPGKQVFYGSTGSILGDIKGTAFCNECGLRRDSQGGHDGGMQIHN